LINSSRYSEYSWLRGHFRRSGKKDLERTFNVLIELAKIARAGFHSLDEYPTDGATFTREPFLSFVWPFIEKKDREGFHVATATAFRAGAFPWAKDPVSPLLALEIDQLFGAFGKPLHFLNASLDALGAWLSPKLESDPAFRAAFDAVRKTSLASLPRRTLGYAPSPVDSSPVASRVSPMETEIQEHPDIINTELCKSVVVNPGTSLVQSVILYAEPTNRLAAGLRYRLYLQQCLPGSGMGSGASE